LEFLPPPFFSLFPFIRPPLPALDGRSFRGRIKVIQQVLVGQLSFPTNLFPSPPPFSRTAKPRNRSTGRLPISFLSPSFSSLFFPLEVVVDNSRNCVRPARSSPFPFFSLPYPYSQNGDLAVPGCRAEKKSEIFLPSLFLFLPPPLRNEEKRTKQGTTKKVEFSWGTVKKSIEKMGLCFLLSFSSPPSSQPLGKIWMF